MTRSSIATLIWVAIVIVVAVTNPGLGIGWILAAGVAGVVVIRALGAAAREITRRRTGAMTWELGGGLERRGAGSVSEIVVESGADVPSEVADATRFELVADPDRRRRRISVLARGRRVGELPYRTGTAVVSEMRRHGVDHLLVEGELTSRYKGYVLLPHDFADASPELAGAPRAFPVPVPMAPWGDAAQAVDAVRADFFVDELAALYPEGRPPDDSRQRTLTGLEAEIFPTGRGIFGIFIHDAQIAWLGAEQCGSHGEVLEELARLGRSLTVRASARLGVGSKPACRVRVWLPPVDQILPPEQVRGPGFVLLPPGSKIQVTRGQDHLDELMQVLDGRPEASAAARLYRFTRQGARTSRDVVGVRIDGHEAGELTDASGAHFIEVLKACEERDLELVCRARVQGNRLKVDVTLNAVKGAELSDQWIADNIGER